MRLPNLKVSRALDGFVETIANICDYDLVLNPAELWYLLYISKLSFAGEEDERRRIRERLVAFLSQLDEKTVSTRMPEIAKCIKAL